MKLVLSQILPLVLLCSVGLTGCEEEGGSTGKDELITREPSPLAVAEGCSVIVSDLDCNTKLRPIVFVHGTFGSGDNIAHVAQLFGSNGYCQERFVAVEYNSLGGSPLTKLDALIDEIRAQTGQDKVDLMGHSQGTGHCVDYLQDAARAGKVAHYVNLSGRTAVPNAIPTLSLSSNNDLGGAPIHAPNAEKQVTFTDQDHFGVASSTEAFVEIYKYLIGKEPKFTEIQCGDDEVTIEGIAETFGDNAPIVGGKLEVYELSTQPYERGTPVLTVQSDPQGRSGAFKLKRNTPYEFKALDADGKLVGHVYFAPFKRSNRLVRFLGPSENILVSSLSTDRLVLSPNHTVIVARTLAGAFRQDLGHSLKIDGREVLTPENAGRAANVVGLFMSDQNLSEGSDLGVAFSAPFVMGTDVFMSSKQPKLLDIEWNGQHLSVPNWPSAEGFISLNLP